MKTFPAIICICSILLLPALSLSADFYVNGATGNDNNSCTSSDHPCKTIWKALDKTPVGTSTIKISKGLQYIEKDLNVPHHHYITFEGGWNNDFTVHENSAQSTIIETGSKINHDALFNLLISGSGQWASMTLKNMTLRYKEQSEIKRAINANSTNEAKAWLTLQNVQITKFDQPSDVIETAASGNGVLTINFNESDFSDNPGTSQAGFGSTIFRGLTSNEGKLNIIMKKIRINHNGFNSLSNENTLLLWFICDGGTLDATIENSMITGNRSNTVFSLPANGNSNAKLNIINDTISKNRAPGTYALNAYARGNSNLTVNMTNTIFTDNNGSYMYLSQEDSGHLTVNVSHCLVDSFPQPYTEGGATYTHSDNIDNSLIYWPHLDSRFHLRSGSPAIDAGICGYWDQSGYQRIAPDDDIDGDKRPGLGTYLGCDIGADEYKAFPWPMFLPAIIHGH